MSKRKEEFDCSDHENVKRENHTWPEARETIFPYHNVSRVYDKIYSLLSRQSRQFEYIFMVGAVNALYPPSTRRWFRGLQQQHQTADTGRSVRVSGVISKFRLCHTSKVVP